MEIKTRLTEQDFIKVTFLLFYRKTYVKIITAVMIYGILSPLLNFITSFNTGYTQLVASVAYGLFLNGAIYFAARKSYRTNKRMSETIEYKFDRKFLDVTGESFQSQSSWDKIYKVTKTRNWLLIWQSSQSANIIPSRDVWQGDLHTLKELLDENGVKNNL